MDAAAAPLEPHLPEIQHNKSIRNLWIIVHHIFLLHKIINNYQNWRWINGMLWNVPGKIIIFKREHNHTTSNSQDFWATCTEIYLHTGDEQGIFLGTWGWFLKNSTSLSLNTARKIEYPLSLLPLMFFATASTCRVTWSSGFIQQVVSSCKSTFLIIIASGMMCFNCAKCT